MAAGLLACGKTKSAPVQATPVPIAREHAAYVTDNGSDEISVLDREDGRVVSVAVDVDPDAHEAPHHLAVDGAGGRAFVLLAFPPENQPSQGKHAGHGRATKNGALVTLDLATLSVQSSRDTEENPGDVILTHDHTRVLVTHFDMARAMREAAAGAPPSKLNGALQVWDAKAMTLTASRRICVAPHGVVVTKDDSVAIVACYGSDEVDFVDLRSPELSVTRVPLGGSPGVLGAPRYGPYGVALSADESIVLAADMESGDVRVVDVASKTVAENKTLTLGARAMMPAFVSPVVALVPLQGPDGLARVNLAENRLEKRASYTDAVCKNPHVVKVAKDGRVYEVCEGDHVGKGAVLEVDPVTLETRKRFEVGVYPDGVEFGE